MISSFIHHSHELQATQMSFNKQAVKQAGARACSGTPLRAEEEGTRTHRTTRRNLQRILANANSQALHVMNSVMSLTWQNSKCPPGLRREWGWGCGWWRVGEVTEGLQEGLCGGGRVSVWSVSCSASNWVQDTQSASVLFFPTTCESMFSQNKKIN